MKFWSGKRDLNSRLQPWQGCTLPLSYSRGIYIFVVNRRTGRPIKVGPIFYWSGKRDLNSRLQPWQGCTLPLSYSREVEAASGFEPENGGFADLCLTTWLCRLILWSGKRDLNSRLQPWQGCTLPLSYSRSRKAKQFLTFCHQTVNTFLKFILFFLLYLNDLPVSKND